ncbi:MAG: hypothetical protein R3F11_13875 [Verrucomicrobiales bacterium]
MPRAALIPANIAALWPEFFFMRSTRTPGPRAIRSSVASRDPSSTRTNS